MSEVSSPQMPDERVVLPLSMPVLTMSGSVVATVRIDSLESRVVKLTEQVAQQAYMKCDVIALLTESCMIPMASTARLHIYEKSLAESKHLYVIRDDSEAYMDHVQVDFPPGPTNILLDISGRVMESFYIKWSKEKQRFFFGGSEEGGSSQRLLRKDSMLLCLDGDCYTPELLRKKIRGSESYTATFKNAFGPEPGSSGYRRLLKEMNDIRRNSCDGELKLFGMPISISEDASLLQAAFPGPEESAYEDGTFHLRIKVPADYPFKPPRVRFVTKVYHCNVDARTGSISLDILQDEWSPVLTIMKVILSIRSLLADPNPHEPIEAEIAKLYLQDRGMHDAEVRDWVQMYG